MLSFAVDEELSDIDKYHWLNISIKFHNVNLMKDLITSGVCVNFPPNVPADADFSPLHNCVEYNLLEGVPISSGCRSQCEHQSFEGLQANSHSSSHCP